MRGSGKQDNGSILKGLEDQLAVKIMGIFESVIQNRTKLYTEHADRTPQRRDVQDVILACANKNSVVSGAATLIPGPWGMAAAVPEIAIVISHQIEMIYDIGVAYGQGKKLTQELLASIFAHALGSGFIGGLTIYGSKVLVQRTSLRAFQKIAQLLAAKVSQRLLKSMVSKWVPVVGAAAMAAWAHYSTKEVGRKAIEIFEKQIEFSPSELDDIPITVDSQPVSSQEAPNLDALKIQALVNLMKIDGQIKPEEREYVQVFIDNAELSDSERATLLSAIDTTTKFTIDYSTIASSPEDAIGLMMDLVALAKQDNQFHISEKVYVKQIGKLLGFSESDIEEAMSS